MCLKYFSDMFSKLLTFLGYLKLDTACTESSDYLLSCVRRGLICVQRHNMEKGAKRAACFLLTVAVPRISCLRQWFLLETGCQSDLSCTECYWWLKAVCTSSSPLHLFWLPLNTVFQKYNFKTYVNGPQAESVMLFV